MSLPAGRCCGRGRRGYTSDRHSVGLAGPGQAATKTLGRTGPAQELGAGPARGLFKLKDGLGSVMGIIDEKTNIVQSYEYSAFGECLSGKDAVNTFRFGGGNGMMQDDATGLTYAWNRWLDTSTGRWLSEDPIRQEGGVNLYGYVGNRPTVGIDPSGLRFVVTGHIITGLGYHSRYTHTAIRYYPKDSCPGSGQMKNSKGEAYTVLSGYRETWTGDLAFEINHGTDTGDQAFEITVYDSDAASEGGAFERLKAAGERYNTHKVDYDFLPEEPGNTGYNSNSMTSGFLNYIGFGKPSFPSDVAPGWNKPLPIQ